jgi:hypothetical protein
MRSVAYVHCMDALVYWPASDVLYEAPGKLGRVAGKREIALATRRPKQRKRDGQARERNRRHREDGCGSCRPYRAARGANAPRLLYAVAFQLYDADAGRWQVIGASVATPATPASFEALILRATSRARCNTPSSSSP